MSELETRTYSGRCHCGAVRIRFRGGPITTACRCNCSLCSRRGATMSSHYIEPDDVLELRGREDLTLYQFGDHVVNHYFCGHCGVYTFHEAVERPGHYRVNLSCVDGIDISGLAIRLIDGRSF